MNLLEQAAHLNEEWKAYWRQANVPYEIGSTWVQDLYIASVFSLESIKKTVNDALLAWKGDYTMITELLLAVNYMAWNFDGSNHAYCQYFTDEYYNILDIMEQDFDNEQLEQLYRLID